MKILIPCILKTVHLSVYKCTVILHVPMGRAHRESSMSKLDYDAKRVANIYMELPSRHLMIMMSVADNYARHMGVIHNKVVSNNYALDIQ